MGLVNLQNLGINPLYWTYLDIAWIAGGTFELPQYRNGAHIMQEYSSTDWMDYKMDWRGNPHPVMENLQEEINVVCGVLEVLCGKDFISDTNYNQDLFMAHRISVKERFEIPWTGISPRMQRLLYAINAIAKPQTMVAMGVFCGNTFISNAGASIGPGACYSAQRLVGIEIVEEEALRARLNVKTVDADSLAEIITGDGVVWLESYAGQIDLLYIDADGSYLRIIEEAAKGKLKPGSLVLAHNSINLEQELKDYLTYVRDPANSRQSINIMIDDQGLEVTQWR